MRALVRREMEAGALGIGSSLIYAPAFYATTEELIELCKVAAQYHGKYISHIRSEGNRLIEAVEELIRISREAGFRRRSITSRPPARPTGRRWTGSSRSSRTRGGAGCDHRRHVHLHGGRDRPRRLDAAVGPRRRLRRGLQAAARSGDARKIAAAIRTPSQATGRISISRQVRRTACCWSSSSRSAQAAHRQDPRRGGDAARRGSGRHDHEPRARGSLAGRHGLLHDVRGQPDQQIKLPWVSFGSDAASMAPEPPFTRSSAHPRAYGNFARLLGKYVRDEKVLTLAEAVRRLTGLPATNLELERRGFIREGHVRRRRRLRPGARSPTGRPSRSRTSTPSA